MRTEPPKIKINEREKKNQHRKAFLSFKSSDNITKHHSACSKIKVGHLTVELI